VAALSVLHKQLWNGASCHETFSGDLLDVGMSSVEGYPALVKDSNPNTGYCLRLMFV
jgi:hypothetical protein